MSGDRRQKARAPEPALPLPGGRLSRDRASPTVGLGDFALGSPVLPVPIPMPVLCWVPAPGTTSTCTSSWGGLWN